MLVGQTRIKACCLETQALKTYRTDSRKHVMSQVDAEQNSANVTIEGVTAVLTCGSLEWGGVSSTFSAIVSKFYRSSDPTGIQVSHRSLCTCMQQPRGNDMVPAPSRRILRSCKRSIPREGAARQRMRLTFRETADSARRRGSMEGARSTWRGASLPLLFASHPTTPLGSQSVRQQL